VPDGACHAWGHCADGAVRATALSPIATTLNADFTRTAGAAGPHSCGRTRRHSLPSQSRPAVTESTKIKTCPGDKEENRNRPFPTAALEFIPAGGKRVEVSIVEVGVVEERIVEESIVVVSLVEWRGKAKSK